MSSFWLLLGIALGMILSLVLKSFLPDLEYLLINWIQSIDLTFSQNQQKHSLSDVIHYSCRVLPHDIDRNCHMNNSVYFKQLNYARKHFWNQLGVWKHLYVKKYNMVVSAQSIRFRRELNLWDYYEISIRLISWCDKSRCFYLESQFLRKGFVHAIHWTKYNLVGKDSPKPSEILFSCSLISSKDAKSILMNDEDLSLWIQANQLSSEKLNPKKKS